MRPRAFVTTEMRVPFTLLHGDRHVELTASVSLLMLRGLRRDTAGLVAKCGHLSNILSYSFLLLLSFIFPHLPCSPGSHVTS